MSELTRRFQEESNRIEGITRPVHDSEVEAPTLFLGLGALDNAAVERLVDVFEPGAHLRVRRGSNVRVGGHVPPRGGPGMVIHLENLLFSVNHQLDTPWRLHCRYEGLHPFTDGSGRSGRAIWAWQMLFENRRPGISLGFLHAFYYQTLENFQ